MGVAGRSTPELLADMVLWGDRIARFLTDVSREDFGRDELRQLAVSKCVEVIGEAAGNILKRDSKFSQAHPEIDLVEAYRMRNRLSHRYDTIDWTILWDTATIYVPPLVDFARNYSQIDGA